MDKFNGNKVVAVIVLDEASHAANCVFIGLKVGDNELLESDDVGCEADQSTRPTDVAVVAGSAKGACAEWPYTSTGMNAATR